MLSTAPVAVVLPTTDLDRAKSFYRDQVGVKLLSDDGPLVFEAGEGTRLQIYLRPGNTPPGHTAAEFRVDDIFTAVNTLKSAGVEFEEYEGMTDHIMTSENFRQAWFRDPDGNFIAVIATK